MNRRKFLAGLGALAAAPAIVKAENIMPVKKLVPREGLVGWDEGIKVWYRDIDRHFQHSMEKDWIKEMVVGEADSSRCCPQLIVDSNPRPLTAPWDLSRDELLQYHKSRAELRALNIQHCIIVADGPMHPSYSAGHRRHLPKGVPAKKLRHDALEAHRAYMKHLIDGDKFPWAI